MNSIKSTIANSKSTQLLEENLIPNKIIINHYGNMEDEEEDEEDMDSGLDINKMKIVNNSKFTKYKVTSGFTLIEILVVIGIISVLALIVLVAINPARQFALSRNAQRTSNVNSILNAVGQNMVDNKGIFTCAAGNLPTIVKNMADYTSDSNGYDIAPCLTPAYLPALPFDPSAAGSDWTSSSLYNTNYTIVQDSATERITVCAPTLEASVGNSIICITR